MSYAANTDILLEYKNLAWNSQLSSGTVDEWCTQASNRIDSYIGSRYQAPVSLVSSPASYSILKSLCIDIVKNRVNEWMRVQSGDAKSSQSKAGRDEKTIQSDLEAIRDLKIVLRDAALQTQTDGVQSYVSSNLPTTTPPTFTREDDDW